MTVDIDSCHFPHGCQVTDMKFILFFIETVKIHCQYNKIFTKF